MQKISFLTPFSRKPSGGIRVTWELAEQLSEVYSTSVWPPVRTRIKSGGGHLNRVGDIDLESHWIVSEYQLPYLINTRHIKNCFSIFIQNPYILFNLKRFDENAIVENIKNAKFIFCISQDAEKIVNTIFPDKMTVRLHWSLDSAFDIKRDSIEHLIETKTNTITYMPRKCSNVYKLLNLLKDIEGYKLKPLSGLSYNELIEALSESKIFIALSEYEGFAAPPMEAYALGNLVVGFAGNGNRDLFRYDNFRKVEQNDFNGLFDNISDLIKQKTTFSTSQYNDLVYKFDSHLVKNYNVDKFKDLDFTQQCQISKFIKYPKNYASFLLDSLITKFHQI